MEKYIHIHSLNKHTVPLMSFPNLGRWEARSIPRVDKVDVIIPYDWIVVITPWKISRLEHNSLEVDGSDHFPFFSWVMAVGSSRSSSRGVSNTQTLIGVLNTQPLAQQHVAINAQLYPPRLAPAKQLSRRKSSLAPMRNVDTSAAFLTCFISHSIMRIHGNGIFTFIWFTYTWMINLDDFIKTLLRRLTQKIGRILL